MLVSWYAVVVICFALSNGGDNGDDDRSGDAIGCARAMLIPWPWWQDQPVRQSWPLREGLRIPLHDPVVGEAECRRMHASRRRVSMRFRMDTVMVGSVPANEARFINCNTRKR